MYAGFAMTFCFMEFFETESRRLKLFNILSYIFLALFIILLRSRAGLLCTIILFALQWVWLAFIKRQRRNSIIIASVFIIGKLHRFPTKPCEDNEHNKGHDHRAPLRPQDGSVQRI